MLSTTHCHQSIMGNFSCKLKCNNQLLCWRERWARKICMCSNFLPITILYKILLCHAQPCFSCEPMIHVYNHIYSNKYSLSKRSQHLVMGKRWANCYQKSKFCLKNVIFSSPEPKAHRWAYSVGRHPLSVGVRRHRLSTFSNDISEAMKPILTKFHI